MNDADDVLPYDFTDGFPVVTFTACASVALLVLIGSAAFLIYKKMLLESELKGSWWQVKWDEIKFAEKQASGRKSMTSLASASQATLSSTGYATLTAASTGSAASSMNTTCANVSGVLVGMYKVI
jgi:hypothetical protein